MVRSEVQGNPYDGESLYAGVTKWAAHASLRVLMLLGTIGLSSGGVVLLLDWRRWPAAGVLMSLGTIGVWGLIEQKASHPHSLPVAAAEWTLVGLGTLLAFLAALGLLFWFLGPAPIL